MPVPSNQVLVNNLVRRIKDSYVYTKLARDTTSTIARSAHYRAAMMIVATIVEGLTIYLIRKAKGDENPVVLAYTELRRRYDFDNVTSPPQRVFVMEEVDKEAKLNDVQCTIKVMNYYCLKEGLITEPEHRALELVRRRRNSIHIQTLMGNDRGYTKAGLDRMEAAVDILLARLRVVIARRPR